MKAAPTSKIQAVVDKCPTQAISWKYNKDLSPAELSGEVSHDEEITPDDLLEKPVEEANNGVTISVMKQGPLLVEGDFRVIGPEGNELRTMIITSFCRCGHSRAQPYCDGTHRKVGFEGG